MGFLSDARKEANALAHGERDYPIGSGGYPQSYEWHGADPSLFAPAEFGTYILKSNPVYSVVTQRADYLSSLPLRLFKMTGESALAQVPRAIPGSNNPVLDQILEVLDTKLVGRESTRNSIAQLAQVRTHSDLRETKRQLGLEEITEGPAWELLHKVNDFWSMNRLISMTSMARDIWGQGYWVINRGEGTLGEPEEIWWVRPNRMRPIAHPEKYISHYEFDPLNGSQPIVFFPWEVVRLYRPNPTDEFQPLSALSSTSIYADHERASMQGNINLHKQGMHPGAIVMPKGGTIWTKEQAREVEKEVNDRLGGVSQAHRWGTFRHEVIIDRSAITPRESEFLGGMDYDLEAVARAYHWPIDLLAGKRTYENVEQAFKMAWQAIAMEGAAIAADIAEFFLPMFSEDNTLLPFFDTTNIAVLQETESVKWDREKTQIDKVITRNEWRVGKGLLPLDGGDDLYIPANTIALPFASTEPPELPEGQETDVPLIGAPGQDEEKGVEDVGKEAEDKATQEAMIPLSSLAKNGARKKQYE